MPDLGGPATSWTPRGVSLGEGRGCVRLNGLPNLQQRRKSRLFSPEQPRTLPCLPLDL